MSHRAAAAGGGRLGGVVVVVVAALVVIVLAIVVVVWFCEFCGLFRVSCLGVLTTWSCFSAWPSFLVSTGPKVEALSLRCSGFTLRVQVPNNHILS